MGTKEVSSAERIRAEAHDWVVALEETPVSDTDRKRFELWLAADPRHVESYDRAITVSSAVSALSFDDIDCDVVASYQQARIGRLADATTTLRRTKTWAWGLGGMVAASITAAVMLLQPPIENEPATAAPAVVATYRSAVGEKSEVALPDGTVALLDGRTQLAIAFSAEKRQVTVQSGAAFFDVVPDSDRPFSVESGELTAVALGTRFDVRTTGLGFRVGVEDGEVEVRYPFTIGGKSTATTTVRSLRPGQTVAATLRNGLGDIEDVGLKGIAAWRNDRLVFKGATIAEFVADLNRRSTIPIALEPADSFSDFRIDGAFVANDVDRLLLALTEMHPVEIDRSDPTVLLIRRR
ncbi:MAG: FecR domain-containing protein [Pseudomonadota bacterium]